MMLTKLRRLWTDDGWTKSLAGVCVFSLLLAGPVEAVGQEEASQKRANWEYTLGSGDVVRITVFGQEDLSGEFSVGGGGVISMPLIGDVRAEGRTMRQLEDGIADALHPDYLVNPRVSVEVLNFRPFYIIGEVQKPGGYPFVNGMTILNAIALAGGYTYRARESKMYIKRGDDPSGKEQEATETTVVRPGDIIRVPERFF